MKIRKFKILLSCFLAFVLTFSLVISVSASNSSVNDSDNVDAYNFTPFNLSLQGDLYNELNNNKIYSYNVPLPNMFVDLDGNLSPYVDYSINYDLGVYAGSVAFDISSFFVDTDPHLINVNVYSSKYSDDSYYFQNDASFLFQDCYLTSRFDVSVVSGSGVSFVAYDNVYYDNPQLYSATVRGQFFLPGSRETYSSIYNYGSYLSYYAILVNSDVPWADFYDFYSARFSVEEFESSIEAAKSFDFLALTNDQITLLSSMFGWVGYIYGLFSVNCFNFYYDGNINCNLNYYLCDHSQFTSFFKYNVDQSTYSGLTGFERVTKFMGSAVGGFLNLEIMPGFSFSGFLIVFIAFALVMWWLKVFAGG